MFKSCRLTSKVAEKHQMLLWQSCSARGTSSQSSHVLHVTDPTTSTTANVKDIKLKPYLDLPGPKGYPVLGTLPQYMGKKGFKFNKMFEVMQVRANKYGPVYRERIGHMEHVVISDPKEYLKVIQVDGKFPNRIEMEPMAEYRRRRGMELGMVNGQGEDWYKHRALLVQKTLKYGVIQGYASHMDLAASDFAAHLSSISSSDGAVKNLEMEIFKWALESIGTVLFDERIGCFKTPPPPLARDFIINLMGLFKYQQPLMYSLPFYKLYRTKDWRKYENYSDEVIKIGRSFVEKKINELQHSRGSAEGSMSFLTSLLDAADFDVELVTSNCVDLMMGAVETTSNSLLWLLHCLSTNPEAQESLYKEIRESFSGKSLITAEDLQQIPYIKACLKETFRLYPITFATSRRIAQEIEICGYRIPKGTHCQANIYGMGRDENLFENPERFQPERWIRATKDAPISYFPNLIFGHGPRMCIGRRLAEQELYIIIAKLFQHFEVISGSSDVQPVLNTVMTPDRPLQLYFRPRHN